MTGPDVLQALGATIVTLHDWLACERIPHAFIGAVAVGLLARSRSTKDVDGIVMLEDGEIEAFLARSAANGFPPRLREAAAFARSRRVLLLEHSATGVGVDLSIGGLAFERDAIRHAVTVPAFGRRLPVVRPSDLVILKAVAGRSQDYADISTILKLRPRMDRQRIRRLVSAFADALERPELAEAIDEAFRLADRERQRLRLAERRLSRAESGSSGRS